MNAIERFDVLDAPPLPEEPPDLAPPLGERLIINDSMAPTKTTIRPTPFSWPDCASIPRREWLYGRHLVRGFVSATVAPGGVGKSSLIIAESLSMVSSRALLHGVAPSEALNVWLWNGEDPLDELNRRIAATAKHFGIEQQDCRGRGRPQPDHERAPVGQGKCRRALPGSRRTQPVGSQISRLSRHLRGRRGRTVVAFRTQVGGNS